jgi:hypothetical protein
MIRIAFVSVSHASNKRAMSQLFRPANRFMLRLERRKHVAGVILYGVILYWTTFRTLSALVAEVITPAGMLADGRNFDLPGLWVARLVQ